jgi:hypothetical protein
MQCELKTKEEIRDFIVGLREDGLSFRQIGEYLKISHSRVRQILLNQYESPWKCRTQKILKRDNYECQFCFNNKNLHVHHINGNPKDNRKENQMTLCADCHQYLHVWSPKLFEKPH